MYINSLTNNFDNNNNNSSNENAMSAGAGYSVSKDVRNTDMENVHFIDGDTPWKYEISASSDETTKLSGFTDANLGDFLSRPIKIRQYSWTPGGTRLFQVFNPWTDFFDNVDVRDKINRFRNLRCNLHLKVLVNGNSFYYGRALLSYNPYLDGDEVTKNRAFFQQDLVQASQKPHLMLDPCSSQGGEMMLPFIWPENYLDITSPNWADQMGRCTIHDFDVLRHANGGTDPITVSVFCWAENLVLSVPTTTSVQSGIADRPLDEFGFPLPYVDQAGSSGKKSVKKMNNSQNDEFACDGLISKPASAIAKVSDMLTMIPVMAPYAKATSMVATKIGQVARIFGYSRPQVLSDSHVYVPRYMGNLTNSDVAENLVKLSLDSKNELSIDTRLMGLGGEDELTINSICQRPSYWRQFNWPESATTDSLLTSFVVSPIYYQQLTASPVNELHMTSLAYGALPFSCWQGSLKFRFNVICSEYHRGRLRIVYNPNKNNTGIVPFNQVYSTVVDISENRDFEYEVKWADIRAWAKVDSPHRSPALYPDRMYQNSTPVTPISGADNGTVSVYVVNELATPSTVNADVKIQIWVSAGDDFAVAVPTTMELNQISPFQQQADIAPDSMISTTDMSNAPTMAPDIATFAPGDKIKDHNQYLVYQGERIVSFRELLRRYQYHNSYYPSLTGTGGRIVTEHISDFPYYRGWDPQGQDQGFDAALSNSPYTFCTLTLLNYLTPAFACRRGCLRHKTIVCGKSSSSDTGTLHVARFNIDGSNNQTQWYSTDFPNVGTKRFNMQETQRPSLGGTHITPVGNNPCLEYETPFYTLGQRFVAGRTLNYYSGAHSAHELSTEVDGSTEPHLRIDKYVSIGEDFQLGMFTGAPILYSYPNPIAFA